jgi:hypothetical protein
VNIDGEMEQIRSILGQSTFAGSDDADAWLQLKQAIGTSLPAGFREFVREYGPGIVNTALYVRHPSLGSPTLIKAMLGQMQFFSEFFLAEGLPYRVGSALGQFLPFAHMMDGVDLFFLVGDPSELDWKVCAIVPEDGSIEEFPWGFCEWLLRYLEGDDRCSWLSGSSTQEPNTFSDEWAY